MHCMHAQRDTPAPDGGVCRVMHPVAHAARLELKAFDGVVTDWELRRNFERI